MIDPALFDQARDRIAETGFSPEIQSKISLVLCAAKNGNLAFQNAMQWLPNLGVVQPFVISQAAREMEAIALLTRTTQWANDPALAMEAGRIAAPLAIAWTQIMMPPGPMFDPQAVYRGISLGHAQLARIRLAAIVPDNADPLAPFVVALARIEQENGRMLQTQIRLLKNIATDIPLEQREVLVERDQELVDGVFNALLAWLAAP
jgi:hypothetical protein